MMTRLVMYLGLRTDLDRCGEGMGVGEDDRLLLGGRGLYPLFWMKAENIPGAMTLC